MRKQMFAVFFVVCVFFGFGAPKAQANPPVPIGFSATLTDFGSGTQTQAGGEFLIRDLPATALVTGDLGGTADWVVNYNINLITNKAVLWGEVLIETTGGLCVGAFEGTFSGTSTFDPNTGALFPDEGRLSLHGSGGCAGYQITADFEESVDGVFEIAGSVQ